jgi:hypothetical protein
MSPPESPAPLPPATPAPTKNARQGAECYHPAPLSHHQSLHNYSVAVFATFCSREKELDQLTRGKPKETKMEASVATRPECCCGA